MRLTWVLRAGLPTPLCNRPLFDLGGRLLGYPDLFDPIAGVVGEYDGADHTVLDRRGADSRREHGFREHGLEYFAVVAGEHPDVVAARMLATRSRALFLPPAKRLWTLQPPPWWVPPTAR